MIIVIAIMAILVGVIVPNLLRYIERANIAADIQTADSMSMAYRTALIDLEAGAIVLDAGMLVPSTLVAEIQGSVSDGDKTTFTLCNGTLCGSGGVCANSRAHSPLGTAVAETLGYPDYQTMVGPDGIINEFRTLRGENDYLLFYVQRLDSGEIGMYFASYNYIPGDDTTVYIEKYFPEHLTAASFGDAGIGHVGGL